MENTSYPNQQSFFEKNKTIIKGFLIGFLILLMLIPSSFVQSLVYERQSRQADVIKEVSSKWAASQTITGPVLYIPYKEFEKDKDGKVIEYTKTIYLLPEQLIINGKLFPEVRHRSLYDVTLYKSDMVISGDFNFNLLNNLKINTQNIIWSDCYLMMGIDDARGLEEEVKLIWGKEEKTLEAGLPENTVLTNGLSVPLQVDSQNNMSFTINLKLKGSELFYFTPVGKTTKVSINSSWKNPAFDGQYLPISSKITESGFTANWKVLQVSRNYPQSWIDGKFDLKNSAFGVRLIQPTDSYSKTDRSVKYAILFIALTFTVFFFLEILQKKQIHPLLYILVGFALCIFYTLLLSISEYTGFNAAYIIASISTITLIGMYIKTIFKERKIALGFTISLAGLYTYIFILIQLQDYALLFGSIGLFIIIAVLMYFSRKIDWYNAGRNDQNN